MRPTYDDSSWPLLIATMPSELSDTEFDTHNQTLAEYLARREVFALVSDSRRMPPLTTEGRKAAAEFMRSQAALAKDYLAAVALVHSASVQNHIFTAILWIVKPPVMVRIFTNVEDARIWALEKLRQRRR